MNHHSCWICCLWVTNNLYCATMCVVLLRRNILPQNAWNITSAEEEFVRISQITTPILTMMKNNHCLSRTRTPFRHSFASQVQTKHPYSATVHSANYCIFPVSIAMKNDCFHQTSYREEDHHCMCQAYIALKNDF